MQKTRRKLDKTTEGGGGAEEGQRRVERREKDRKNRYLSYNYGRLY